MNNYIEQSVPPQRIDYKGVTFDGFCLWPDGPEAFIDFVKNRICNSHKTFITYLNAHTYNISASNRDYRNVLQHSDILYPDGISISIATWLKCRKWLVRMTGLDFFDAFLAMCEKEGFKLYFLGGGKGIAEKARNNILGRYKNLNIVGVHDGFFITDGISEGEIISNINKKQANVLIVGMGSPIQEFFAYRNRNEIDSSVIWTVGALLDYYAGIEKQSPRWLAKMGFEWAYRLVQDPRGKWRRYLIGNWRFAYNIYKVLMRGRE